MIMQPKNLSFLFVFLCSFILLCSFVNAQTITIEGRLIDRESKSPIPNIEISSSFYEDSGKEIIETMAITDDNGLFKFDLNILPNENDLWWYHFKAEEIDNNFWFNSRYHKDLFFLLIRDEIYIFNKNYLSEYDDDTKFQRVDLNSGERIEFNIIDNIFNIGDIYPVKKDFKIVKFKGYLLDQITSEPVVNAKIGDLDPRTGNIPGITNEQGYFEFEVIISNWDRSYFFRVDNVDDCYNVYKYSIVRFRSEYDDDYIADEDTMEEYFDDINNRMIKTYKTIRIKRENRTIYKISFDGQGDEELFFDMNSNEIDLGNLYLYPMFDMLIESDVKVRINQWSLLNNLDSYTDESGYLKRAYIKKFLPVNYQSELFIARSPIFYKTFELKIPIGNPKEEFIYVTYKNGKLSWEKLPISQRPNIYDITYNDVKVIKEKEKIESEFGLIIRDAQGEYFDKYGYHMMTPPSSVESIELLIQEGFLSEDFYTKYCYGCYDEFNNETFFQHNCFDFGFKKDNKYCSLNGTFNEIIAPGESCNYNHQCESNSCNEKGFCNKEPFTQRLIKFFKNLF